jgi:hypothetical protein
MSKHFDLFKKADTSSGNTGSAKNIVETAIDTAITAGEQIAPASLKNAVKAIRLIYLGGSAGYSAISFAETGNPVDAMDTTATFANLAGPHGRAFATGWSIGRLAGELGLDKVINNFISTIQDDSDLMAAQQVGDLLESALKAKDKQAGIDLLQSAQNAIAKHFLVIAAKPPTEKRNAAIKSLRSLQTYLDKIKDAVSKLPDSKPTVPSSITPKPAIPRQPTADESTRQLLGERIEHRLKELASGEQQPAKSPKKKPGPDDLR